MWMLRHLKQKRQKTETTPGMDFLNSVFQKVKEESEEESESEEETTLESPVASDEPGVVEEIVGGLERGETTVDDLNALGATLQSQIDSLKSQGSLTDLEAKELSDARKMSLYIQQALSEWKERNKPVSDIIDDVLYFKFAESSGPYKSLSNFFPVALNIAGEGLSFCRTLFPINEICRYPFYLRIKMRLRQIS